MKYMTLKLEDCVENEFLKLQVVHLNDSLAQLQLQQAQNAPFRATEKGFFQLSKSTRNTKKRRINKMVIQSVQRLMAVKARKNKENQDSLLHEVFATR